MQTVQAFTTLSHLSCSQCGQRYSVFDAPGFATCCNQPLLAAYELPGNFSRTLLRQRPANMWRYREVLPVLEAGSIVSLGEGMTPLLTPRHLRAQYELPQLFIKDESVNPTGSFKARGMSAAISKAKEAGAHTCIVPTAGNAGGAMAAYCAAAGIKAIVVMPGHTPQVFKDECLLFGAELVLVDGLISDCAKKVAQLKQSIDCFDVSTLKEPWRLEGKKTMGYEIAEQFEWTLPDVILYPTGGGTGLIGMWKAFDEMEQLGWIGAQRPRMIAVQAATCQPIVHTWNGVQANARNYVGRPSLANGLAVPNPFAENLILRVLRSSGGRPVPIADADMIAGVKEVAKQEGILMAPEGGALWAALQELLKLEQVKHDEKILLLNTGSGYKYLENMM